ncbi:MAG: 4Fe-4S dicluster domain-containing protein [Thermodesulfobacteriota bacterium]|nr:4Fe-4S dicluster domain-containing protein [Thermodesulfobacteriota bacterium]
MHTIHIKKGLRLNMAGTPAMETKTRKDLERLVVSAEPIPHIKTRLQVGEGDRVALGSVLFTDKRNPDIRFLSPGGGLVETIEYGPRRAIRRIVVKLDETEAEETFPALKTGESPEILGRDELVKRLTTGGVWPYIRSLPFRDFADPKTPPPAVVVLMDCLDLFHAPPEIYLNEREAVFETGLQALSTLAPVVSVVISAPAFAAIPDAIQQAVTHKVAGAYPADDPGVFVYKTRTAAEANTSWYIHGADVVLLGQFLTDGRFPTDRVVAVSSPDVKAHFHTRIGAPVSALVPNIEALENHRIIAGGVFRGHGVGPGAGVNYYDTAVTVLPEGNADEFFGFLRPGFRKPSQWRTFLSALNAGPFEMDTGLHGEERACINCGTCATVCPVDILPQFTMKSLVADEIEEALSHGLLDCVECGLCSYVCPSKVDLCEQLRHGRQRFYKEQAAS